MNLCVSTRSLKRALESGMTLPEFGALCRRLGVEAVELENRRVTAEQADAVRESLEREGCRVVCLALANDFTRDDPGAIEEEVSRAKEGLLLARGLGATVVRVLTGASREGPGVLEQVVACFQRLAGVAENLEVRMALENHRGISRDSRTLLEIVEEVDSPNFGANPDFGNFPDETRYQDLERLIPRAFHAHAKATAFDTSGEEMRIDYARVLSLFSRYGYTGCFSVEFEGEGDEEEGVRRTLDLLRRYGK